MARDRVVVIGAAGFLGQACTAALAAAGFEVDGIDTSSVGPKGAATWTVADVLADGIPDRLLATDR